MSKLQEHYEIVRREPSDVVDHLQTFIDLVVELQATKVIELGVRYGVSTTAWLWALRNRGHLWAVDGAPPVEEPTMKVDLLNPLMDLDHWTFILGWDNDPNVLSQLPDDADIVFIDTNHTYELTREELGLYYPRVRPGGRILLHDTAIEVTGNATTPQPPFPVLTAMREFCAANELTFDNDPNCCGLGTIYC